MLKIIAFYKYTSIENPEKFKKQHLDLCKSLNLRGRILVAKEGINGSVSGTNDQIDKYKKHLLSNNLFSGIEFKEDSCLMHPFNKMKIKVKQELVRFEQNVSLNNAGKHLSPEEFMQIANEEDSTIILDARNHYESRVGKFKKALTPRIKTFREFPQVIKSIETNKDKKILMYCTGGIRCEKASAYLKSQGFNQVYQLHGGILNFIKTLPQSDLWEGKCFVFDKRLLSSSNANKLISNCEICNIPCDLYKNCRNNSCDKLAITCLDCERSLGGCCSKDCFDILFARHNLLENQ